MLPITIPATEGWDEKNEVFVEAEKAVTLHLEHSLVSLSKWESKWHKPFLLKSKKTREEILDYIRCMTLTQNVDPSVYSRISDDIIDEIYNYINDSMTATTIPKDNSRKGGSHEIVTAELIYYWMIALNIPFECQKWHLNRLLTLIQVCNVKNSPRKKMSKRDLMSRNAALNAARKKQFNTRG
jgi:hypothetical protein